MRDSAHPAASTGSAAVSRAGIGKPMLEPKLEAALFESVFLHSPFSITIVDTSGVIVDCNEQTSRITGRPRREIVGTHYSELLASAGNDTQFDGLFRQLMSGDAVSPIDVALRVDGRDLLLEVIPALVKVDGIPVSIQIIARDVSEERVAQEKLVSSERHNKELLERLPLTVFEADMHGRISSANTTGIEMFGYSQEDDIGCLRIPDMVAPRDRQRATLNFMRILKEGREAPGTEYMALKKNGEEFPIRIFSRPIVSDGKVSGIQGIIVDVSQQRETEKLLAEASKMESLGRLAGGISHDFNNLLQIVLGSASMAELLNRSKDVGSYIGNVIEAAKRAVSLTGQLQMLAKGMPPATKACSIGAFIQDTCRLSSIGTAVSLDFEIQEGLWPANVDLHQIGQVIGNMIINSCQAMPQGGNIFVRAGNCSLSDGEVRGLEAGRYVVISITDDGNGIPEEIIGKIFDPYFSTKPITGSLGGQGLGLSTSLSIVRNHHGTILVDSEVGVGTAFEIYLPASDSDLVRESSTEVQAPVLRSGRILFVDDEQMVRNLAERMIRRIGCEVVLASSGSYAIELVKKALESGSPFDVVVTDLTMPGMTGDRLIAEIRRLQPEVKVVLSSGYNSCTTHEFGVKVDAVLPKPYQMTSLTEVIAKLLPAESVA